MKLQMSFIFIIGVFSGKNFQPESPAVVFDDRSVYLFY